MVVGVAVPEEVEQPLGLCRPRAEVDVGDEQRAHAQLVRVVVRVGVPAVLHARKEADSGFRHVTPTRAVERKPARGCRARAPDLSLDNASGCSALKNCRCTQQWGRTRLWVRCLCHAINIKALCSRHRRCLASAPIRGLCLNAVGSHGWQAVAARGHRRGWCIGGGAVRPRLRIACTRCARCGVRGPSRRRPPSTDGPWDFRRDGVERPGCRPHRCGRQLEPAGGIRRLRLRDHAPATGPFQSRRRASRASPTSTSRTEAQRTWQAAFRSWSRLARCPSQSISR